MSPPSHERSIEAIGSVAAWTRISARRTHAHTNFLSRSNLELKRGSTLIDLLKLGEMAIEDSNDLR